MNPKDFGVHEGKDGNIFERAKRIVERSAETIMIIWIVLSFSLLTIWVSLEYKELKNQKVVDSPYQNHTIEQLKAAHRYHGILFSKQNKNREWYFMRNGKKCFLFKEE